MRVAARIYTGPVPPSRYRPGLAPAATIYPSCGLLGVRGHGALRGPRIAIQCRGHGQWPSVQGQAGYRPSAARVPENACRNQVDVTNESWKACFGPFTRIFGACTFANRQCRPGLGPGRVSWTRDGAAVGTRTLSGPDRVASSRRRHLRRRPSSGLGQGTAPTLGLQPCRAGRRVSGAEAGHRWAAGIGEKRVMKRSRRDRFGHGGSACAPSWRIVAGRAPLRRHRSHLWSGLQLWGFCASGPANHSTDRSRLEGSRLISGPRSDPCLRACGPAQGERRFGRCSRQCTRVAAAAGAQLAEPTPSATSSVPCCLSRRVWYAALSRLPWQAGRAWRQVIQGRFPHR